VVEKVTSMIVTSVNCIQILVPGVMSQVQRMF